MHTELKEKGIRCSRNRLARLMRKYQIAARPLRRFAQITDSDHTFPVAENALNREFSAETANSKWTSDITYVWTSEG